MAVNFCGQCGCHSGSPGTGRVPDPNREWWQFWKTVPCEACGGDGYAKPPGWPSVTRVTPSPPPPRPKDARDATVRLRLKDDPQEISTYQLCSLLGDGTHCCGIGKGWLLVEKRTHRDGQMYDVMWTSGETTHNRLKGPCISVQYFQDHIGLVLRSAITMWIVRDEDERTKWVQWLDGKVKEAVRYKTASSRSVQ